ncbi:MAG: hypothetical protein MMC33_009525 [Icmadophila ericetorum]|nr:hypothetical protein [Icmadophila ericetorum]
MSSRFSSFITNPYPYALSASLEPNRRSLLNHSANLAQIFTLLPLLLYHITSPFYQYLVYLAETSSFAKQSSQTARISGKKHDDDDGRVPGRRWAARILRWWRVASWWLDSPLLKPSRPSDFWSLVFAPLWLSVRWVFGERNGTRREFAVFLVWVGWLGCCVFGGTADDYLLLTKRFAIVAASQLPIHYLLSAKSPLNPIQRLLRLSHEELNVYHRLLGRIVLIFVLTHAGLYLNFYIQKDLLFKRIKDIDVQLGLLAATSLTILGTTAISFVRSYSYRLFYGVHILVSISLLPILYFHVVHIRIYILETATICLLSALCRLLRTKLAFATVSSIEDTSLISLSIHIPAKTAPPLFYLPGQHVYISLFNPTSRLPVFTRNPFSIASLPYTDPDETKTTTVDLVIRILNGTTKSLSKLAAQEIPVSSSSSNPSIPLLISPPYGASRYFPPLLSYDHVLLVAGGVGVTFTLPIYQSLLHQYESTLPPVALDSPALPPKLTFVWTARAAEEMEWAMPKLSWTPDSLDSLMGGRPAYVKLYITSPGDFESGGKRKSITMRRPDFGSIVDNVFEGKGDFKIRRVAVLICGPEGMARDLRGEFGKWVVRGKEVWWHNEHFGW